MVASGASTPDGGRSARGSGDRDRLRVDHPLELGQSIRLAADRNDRRRHIDRGDVVAGGRRADHVRVDGHSLCAQLAADLDLDMDRGRIQRDVVDDGTTRVHGNEGGVFAHVKSGRVYANATRLGSADARQGRCGADRLYLADAQGHGTHAEPRRDDPRVDPNGDALGLHRIERDAYLLRLVVDDLDPLVLGNQLDLDERVVAAADVDVLEIDRGPEAGRRDSDVPRGDVADATDRRHRVGLDEERVERLVHRLDRNLAGP